MVIAFPNSIKDRKPCIFKLHNDASIKEDFMDKKDNHERTPNESLPETSNISSRLDKPTNILCLYSTKAVDLKEVQNKLSTINTPPLNCGFNEEETKQKITERETESSKEIDRSCDSHSQSKTSSSKKYILISPNINKSHLSSKNSLFKSICDLELNNNQSTTSTKADIIFDNNLLQPQICLIDNNQHQKQEQKDDQETKITTLSKNESPESLTETCSENSNKKQSCHREKAFFKNHEEPTTETKLPIQKRFAEMKREKKIKLNLAYFLKMKTYQNSQ
ncbi:hypothetical protein CDIK_3215 [Cucumispora dikerogammari]|nr:hypothetical protein CDIK_3215 [Cucumispora dikerogammari]